MYLTMGELQPRVLNQPDVSKIPTPPLQAVALFLNFVFPALSLLAVSLRVYTRIWMRQVALDDYLLLIALLSALLVAAPFYFYLKLGYWGWHAADVPIYDPAPSSWWFYLAQIFYNPVLALCKASILVFLLRLGGHKRSVRYAIYGLLAFNGGQAIAVFFVAIFQCVPIAANWDAAVAANATCVDRSFHVITSAITVLTDILVLAIPFWIFVGLKLPLAARLAVIGTFITGLGVTVISIVRAYDIYVLFFVPADPDADPYYNIQVMLNVVEINLAIISASIPALRPLMRRWFPSIFGGSTNKDTNGNYKYGTNPRYGNGTYGRGGAHHGESGLAYGHGGIALKSLSRNDRLAHTEVRSTSPSGSEEEIMTTNGIMRTTDVTVHYDNDERWQNSLSRSSSDFKLEKETAPRAL
ncbi:hypothetical protein F5Y18DRAFT_380055 [Xylariaceae sp. FL1019]|nr:hypothetical protein F5Y18DRAFT_380055 [Xylariaceae sp. FL1019]